MQNSKPTIAFFGTDEVSVAVLEELESAGFLPDLIVTQPDRPQGRKLLLTAPAAKQWAKERGVPVLQPEKLGKEFREDLAKRNWDVFIVASYGNILPQKVLDMPVRKTLNVHPSLLPHYRGPTPVEGAMLDDTKETGVTIMRMDAEMDHGPILRQAIMHFDEWPDKPEVLDQLAHLGGKILAEILPNWIAGTIEEQEQEHKNATYTKLIQKSDGELDLTADDYKNFLKYKAYKPWPGTFFFKENPDGARTRIKITDADFVNGKFVIRRVIPEGKKEVPYEYSSL